MSHSPRINRENNETEQQYDVPHSTRLAGDALLLSIHPALFPSCPTLLYQKKKKKNMVYSKELDTQPGAYVSTGDVATYISKKKRQKKNKNVVFFFTWQ